MKSAFANCKVSGFSFLIAVNFKDMNPEALSALTKHQWCSFMNLCWSLLSYVDVDSWRHICYLLTYYQHQMVRNFHYPTYISGNSKRVHTGRKDVSCGLHRIDDYNFRTDLFNRTWKCREKLQYFLRYEAVFSLSLWSVRVFLETLFQSMFVRSWLHLSCLPQPLVP